MSMGRGKRVPSERRVRGRIRYAQNIFRNRVSVRKIIEHAELDSSDIVYDLGAGTGAITSELVKTGARVVAVELDPNLARKLKRRFHEREAKILEQDIRKVRFPNAFKVVANIPFNHTATIMRRLLFESDGLQEAFLVLQREAARKYCGQGRGTELALKAVPWFELSIVHTFQSNEFVPAPQVAVVLLRINRRRQPLVASKHRVAWYAFVHYAFARGKPDPRLVFRNIFSNFQWQRLSIDLNIENHTRLTNLTANQWVGLFRFFLESVPDHKKKLVTRNSSHAPS